MLISDWSSDVCSSDLAWLIVHLAWQYDAFSQGTGIATTLRKSAFLSVLAARRPSRALHKRIDLAKKPDEYAQSAVDRKSVVQGTGVSVRVALGGRRIIQQKERTIHATEQ